MSDITVEEAFEVIRQEMIHDGPSSPGSYAHSWHCNIAMACHDAMLDDLHVSSESALRVGDEAAARFMKICFDIDTRG